MPCGTYSNNLLNKRRRSFYRRVTPARNGTEARFCSSSTCYLFVEKPVSATDNSEMLASFKRLGECTF